jgi:acyl-CoA reductase-like NAD-dependent aldehyde dehydrogenase
MDVIDKFSLKKKGKIQKTSLSAITSLENRTYLAANSYYNLDIIERRRLIESFSVSVESLSNELADLVTSETGKPIESSRNELSESIHALKKIESAITDQADKGNFSNTGSVLRNPALAGPLIYKASYADPALDFTTASGISLFTGKPLVFVPSTIAPLTATVILEKTAQIFPADMINIVNVDEAGFSKLLNSVNFNTFGFSGKPADFKDVMRKVGIRGSLYRFYENYPVIIWDEENIDSIIEDVTISSFYAGSCYFNRAWKIIVKSDIIDYVRNRMLEISSKLRVGDPMDPMNSMGPVADSKELLAASVFSGMVKSDLGETALAGKVQGNLMEPMLVIPRKRLEFSNPNIGAPLTLLTKADSIEEAVAMANNRLPGSYCSLYIDHIDTMKSAVARLNYASVHVNDLPGKNEVLSMRMGILDQPISDLGELVAKNRLII